MVAGYRDLVQMAGDTDLDALTVALRLPAPDAGPGLSIRPVRTLISEPTRSAPRRDGGTSAEVFRFTPHECHTQPPPKFADFRRRLTCLIDTQVARMDACSNISA